MLLYGVLQLKMRQAEYLRACFDEDARDPRQADIDWGAALAGIRLTRREAEEYLLEAGAP